MWLLHPQRHQVNDIPTRDQEAVREHPAVTTPPQPLGAEECSTRPARGMFELLEARREFGCRHVVGVGAECRDAQRSIWGSRLRTSPTAQLGQMHVGNPGLGERYGK